MALAVRFGGHRWWFSELRAGAVLIALALAGTGNGAAKRRSNRVFLKDHFGFSIAVSLHGLGPAAPMARTRKLQDLPLVRPVAL